MEAKLPEGRGPTYQDGLSLCLVLHSMVIDFLGGYPPLELAPRDPRPHRLFSSARETREIRSDGLQREIRLPFGVTSEISNFPSIFS